MPAVQSDSTRHAWLGVRPPAPSALHSSTPCAPAARAARTPRGLSTQTSIETILRTLVKLARRSNFRRRKADGRRGAALSAVLALGAGACRSVTGNELAVALSARALPGAGAGIALAQGLPAPGGSRLDFELGLERQELADEGPDGDDWTRVWAGLGAGSAASGARLQAHAGVTWLRSAGDPEVLDAPGDYGGVYLGADWLFPLASAFATGPEVSLLYVDAEGDRSGSGAVLELAWRWVWQP